MTNAGSCAALAAWTLAAIVVACSAGSPADAPPGDDGGIDPAGGHDASAGGDDGSSPGLGGEGGRADSSACIGLQCNQVACPGGDTTLSGTVYAPNGTLPLYDVIVYVPNDKLDAVPTGIQCDKCGVVASGRPLVTALTDAQGHFTLKNMPVGDNIPLVVQLGKWRRQTSLPTITRCTANQVTDPNLTRLPKNQTEGNMPHIALTTGTCDNIGCLLPKIGIDPIEFGSESDGNAKAVHVYAGANLTPTPALPGITPASNLWGSFDKLKNYDLSIFSCECEEAPESKGSYGAPAFKAVTDYMNAGGRIFTTDFQYVWYRNSPDPALGSISASNPTNTGIGVIAGGASPAQGPMQLDTSFPKGKALADWLQTVVPSGAYGSVSSDQVFANVTSLNGTPDTWASSGPAPTGPRVFTVNTPVGRPVDQQCGKGVHIDAHVNVSGTDVVGCTEGSPATCYPRTCNDPLKEAEAMFAFFFFDLASCIQNDTAPPVPPPPPPPR